MPSLAQIARNSTLPQRQGLRRERRSANRMYKRGTAANEESYGRLDATLEDIGNDYRGEHRRLRGSLGNAMPGLAAMAGFGGGWEGAHAMSSLGRTVGSGMRGLAQQQGRGLDFTASMRRQGAMQENQNATLMLQDLQSRIDEINQGFSDLNAQQGATLQNMQWEQQQLDEQRRYEEEQQQQANQWYIRSLQQQYPWLRGGGGRDPQPGGPGVSVIPGRTMGESQWPTLSSFASPSNPASQPSPNAAPPMFASDPKLSQPAPSYPPRPEQFAWRPW